MTIQGAIAELQNLLDVDDVPFFYKGGIEKVIETIQMELADRKTQMWTCPKCGTENHMDYKKCPCCGYDRKTEPQRNMAEDIVESFGFNAESYRQAKEKDEPQTERSE